MKYVTKKDVIKRYAEKRKALNEEDVTDLMEAFIGYVTNELGAEYMNDDFAFNIDGFGQFFEPYFDSRDLISAESNSKRIKAEAMLIEWATTEVVKPKKVRIKDDVVFRI